jgi:hypothetical protein
MFVADEEPHVTATQNCGMGQLIAVSPPTLPAATSVDNWDGTGTVTLSWSSGGGAVDGYYVYRSLYDELVGCDSRQEVVGVVTGPSFVDAEAPTNVPLFYRVRAFNTATSSALSPQLFLAVLATVGIDQMAPSREVTLRLVGANPIDGAARLLYSVPNAAHVRIAAYDVSGRLVRELTSGAAGGGEHLLTWDGRDKSGTRRTGVDVLRLSINGTMTASGKVIILR